MLKISLPITPVLLMAVMLTAQAKKASQQQTIFFEGDKCFEHSSPLSADVLRVLLETREGKGALENSGDLDAAARMFRAVEVHLANQEQIDLLVEGVFPLTGADQGWFWVVRSARHNPQVVLFATGNSLELLDIRTNGYRNIRSRWSSPSQTRTRLYRFKNQEYELEDEKRTENRP